MIGTPASENQPLCFVLMPFGSKPDPAGGPDIDFNRIYEKAIKLGIQAADMFPVRADEEKLVQGETTRWPPRSACRPSCGSPRSRSCGRCAQRIGTMQRR